MDAKIIVLTILTVLFNVIAQVLVKLGSAAIDLEQLSPQSLVTSIALNPKLIAGVVFFGLSFVIYALILSKTNLSVAYPIMTSLAYIGVLLLSVLFLEEGINVTQIIGVCCILFGVWLVALNFKGG